MQFNSGNYFPKQKRKSQEKLVPKLTLGPFLTLSVRNGPSLQSFLFQAYIKAELNKTTPYIYEKWLKRFIKTRNVNLELIIRCENYFLMILDFIFEHIPVLKQLPHFCSCHVFETYPGFETITRIHINVNFPAFTHLRNKTVLEMGQVLDFELMSPELCNFVQK